jgi:MoxR-like ATPase
MMNMPFVRLAYNESSEPDQFLGAPAYGDTGKVDPVTGSAILGTYFKPGILPTNWMEPCVLLSDEINLPTEAIQQAYRSGNDSSRVIQVYGNTYRRHDYCFHMAALNPAHDFRNIGAKPMASADSGRYVFHHMPNPSPDMIRKVLNATVERLDHVLPDPLLVTTIINIGEDLRAMSRDGKLPDFWTLRQEVKVARIAPFFGLKGAYDAAYLDYVDKNTRELCETSIRSHMPSGPDWAN